MNDFYRSFRSLPVVGLGFEVTAEALENLFEST